MTEYRLHIRGVTLERPEALAETYPFQIPLLRHGLSLRFEHPITFLVGENGSGKSTIIEALAVAAGLNAEGGSSHTRYSSCPTHSDLHRFLRLDPGYRIKYGYFLRAEAFYAYATWLDQDHEEHVREAMQGPSIRSTAFGHSLHTRSHGEAFWDIIDNQFHDGGLYLLDEPESALSVIRQMALLYRMES